MNQTESIDSLESQLLILNEEGKINSDEYNQLLTTLTSARPPVLTRLQKNMAIVDKMEDIILECCSCGPEVAGRALYNVIKSLRTGVRGYSIDPNPDYWNNDRIRSFILHHCAETTIQHRAECACEESDEDDTGHSTRQCHCDCTSSDRCIESYNIFDFISFQDAVKLLNLIAELEFYD